MWVTNYLLTGMILQVLGELYMLYTHTYHIITFFML